MKTVDARWCKREKGGAKSCMLLQDGARLCTTVPYLRLSCNYME